METPSAASNQPVRERLLEAAYGLFTQQGINRVGVDTIVSASGCAKASLYNNFKSKENLALAFLDRRENLWTRNWLKARVREMSDDPCKRLLGIFDVFDSWFRDRNFEGCSFVNVMLESDCGSNVRAAATGQLANVRAFVRTLAVDAQLADVDAFAACWHMLMKGSIVAAGEGNLDAARQARRAACIVLNGWDRQTAC